VTTTETAQAGAKETLQTRDSIGVISVFGMPGCTSCLRLKEFVESSGLPFENVNLQYQPERRSELQALGIHPPAISVGDRVIPGHNLDEVAELLGIEYNGTPVLTPSELKDRYDTIIPKLIGLVKQMSPENCLFTLPNRERNMLDVASHAATVARAFISAYYKDYYDLGLYAAPGDVSTAQEVVELAEETHRQVNEWWDEDGIDDPFERVIKTYAGHHGLHEVLEREVWHTTQHARQLQLALEMQGIEVAKPLTEDDLRDLPLPKRIHE
jgi:glutaredoxin